MTEHTEKIILDEFEDTTRIYLPPDDMEEATHLYHVALTPVPPPQPDDVDFGFDFTLEE